MTKTIQIGSREIGRGQPCYLIAEVGTTCLGDIDMALRLVSAGASAGMDAVKFQVIDASQLSDDSATYEVMWEGKKSRVSMKEMFSRLEFSAEEWRQVKQACDDAGVDFFATVDYVAGVDLLEEVGVPVHKIGAWDSTFMPLIERIGQTGKPMFVDLGPTTQDEVDDISQWYHDAGGSAVLFLHDYHTEMDREMNMAAVRHLATRQPAPVGYSSPGHNHDLDFLALGLGATFLEKRLIIDRSIKAFHSHESLEPDELVNWVKRIRSAERAIGVEAIRPSAKDMEGRYAHYRSICTTKAVRKGETFTPENLHGKRPGTGMPTAKLPDLWGRKATRDVDADTLITMADVT